MFEIKARDAMGRIGLLHTKHGVVETPVLMPVINPNLMILSPSEMKELFNAGMVITNAYIINKNHELKEKALENGVHELLGFDGAVMTDSGTFQSHVYGKVDVNPLEIVGFQKAIGSDIGTILDLFSEVGDAEQKIKNDVNETIERARKAVGIKNDMMLACPVQGGTYTELRRSCAARLSEIDCDINPIGSVVPLMENYNYERLVEIIVATKEGLKPSRPVHLFGAGHPMLFSLAVLLGCDLFDSASYAKYAKDGRMLFIDGTRKIEELVELPCHCPICSKYSAEDLRDAYKSDEYKNLAMHNLYVIFGEIRAIKQAILEGNLWELTEQRCRVHPNLLTALRALRKHTKFMERFEPISKKSAFFYTGPESLNRPIVHRYRERLFERYTLPKTDVLIGFQGGNSPYSKFFRKEVEEVSKVCDAHFIIETAFGPVPLELDEMYPIAQSVLPKELDVESRRHLNKVMERFSHGLTNNFAVMWDGKETLGLLGGGTEANKSRAVKKGEENLDMQRIRAVSDMQLGKGASDALFTGKIEMKKSKKTGKIRNVNSDGKHVLSMRASDGLFTLKFEGGKKLHEGFKYPRLRVVINDEAVPFVKEGRNVFAGFVIDCDEGIRPLDEVLVVDKNDALIAVGRAILNREEMLAFERGVAVKVREGITKSSDDIDNEES